MPISSDLVAVIMAGGIGTRFWPLSTSDRPKQFLKLMDNRSLLQRCYDRIATIIPPARILVITGEPFVSLVRQQLPDIPHGNIIGEPIRRDTAGTVCLAAFLCQRRFGNPVMAVLPADHVIEPVEEFHQALASAAGAARREGALYTFGIQPTYPATGYGYLERGRRVPAGDETHHYELLKFKEKPDLETARSYLRSGSYFWNSGIFVWTAQAILNAIECHLPEHLRLLAPLAGLDGEERCFKQGLRQAFDRLTPISIDYGVMEKASNIRVVAPRFTWTDLGGWLALEPYLAKDGCNNSFSGRIRTLDASSNIIFCEDTGEQLALVGVKDLIIVRAGRRTLVAHRDRAEDIKKLLN